MPLYDYKCDSCGYFEAKQSVKDHARAECPTCGSISKQVILTAPKPMIEAMAKAGCPGAHETVGNRMEKRHRKAGQYHTATRDQAEAMRAEDAELRKAATVTPAS